MGILSAPSAPSRMIMIKVGRNWSHASGMETDLSQTQHVLSCLCGESGSIDITLPNRWTGNTGKNARSVCSDVRSYVSHPDSIYYPYWILCGKRVMTSLKHMWYKQHDILWTNAEKTKSIFNDVHVRCFNLDITYKVYNAHLLDW